MKKKEFTPYQTERDHLGNLISKEKQPAQKFKSKLSIQNSQIVFKKNEPNQQKTLADYMEVFQDGSEKANFNIFTKKDIIQENMEFQKNQISCSSVISKKSKGNKGKSLVEATFPSIGYYPTMFTQTFQSDKKKLEFRDPNTPKYFVHKKEIMDEWLSPINYKIEQGMQFQKQIDRQKTIQQWVPKIQIYSKQNQPKKIDLQQKLVQDQIKELNYNRLVSNNYKFESQPTISINSKDQTKMPLNQQEMQAKFKNLLKQYQVDEELCDF